MTSIVDEEDELDEIEHQQQKMWDKKQRIQQEIYGESEQEVEQVAKKDRDKKKKCECCGTIEEIEHSVFNITDLSENIRRLFLNNKNLLRHDKDILGMLQQAESKMWHADQTIMGLIGGERDDEDEEVTNHEHQWRSSKNHTKTCRVCGTKVGYGPASKYDKHGNLKKKGKK